MRATQSAGDGARADKRLAPDLRQPGERRVRPDSQRADILFMATGPYGRNRHPTPASPAGEHAVRDDGRKADLAFGVLITENIARPLRFVTRTADSSGLL